MSRSYPVLTVTKKAETALRAGHPWVYDTEITSDCAGIENGAICDVRSDKGAYLGSGLLSLSSKIRVRILSRNANDDFGEAFWARRISYAVDYRIAVMGDDIGCCRLVFGEADGLPGLTVDRYENILVAQVLSYGMEQRREVIYRALINKLAALGIAVNSNAINGIYERDDSPLREKEGLTQRKGWYESDSIKRGESTLTVITENGIKYNVDVENGQKTGFFLDQKYNRLAVSRLAKGKNVLDCFTHTGSFALNAASGGAAHVTAVDISESALTLARENAALNSFGGDSGDKCKMDFLCADVFDLLPSLCDEPHDYDFVILDPPAFTKSRRTISDAERGYKEINYRAMKLLPRGGWLATASCSHFMESGAFERMLLSAASDANVTLKLVEARRQSPDHPVLLGVPETDYLKFYLFQVI